MYAKLKIYMAMTAVQSVGITPRQVGEVGGAPKLSVGLTLM